MINKLQTLILVRLPQFFRDLKHQFWGEKTLNKWSNSLFGNLGATAIIKFYGTFGELIFEEKLLNGLDRWLFKNFKVSVWLFKILTIEWFGKITLVTSNF